MTSLRLVPVGALTIVASSRRYHRIERQEEKEPKKITSGLGPRCSKSGVATDEMGHERRIAVWRHVALAPDSVDRDSHSRRRDVPVGDQVLRTKMVSIRSPRQPTRSRSEIDPELMPSLNRLIIKSRRVRAYPAAPWQLQ